MLNKLKLIFLPFLLIEVSFIGVYTFFNWFLFIHLDLFPVRETIRNFGLPLLLPWIPLLLWLKPKLNLLEFKRNNRTFFYLIAAGLLIACPAIITQEYLKTATGKLTELASINDIGNHKKTKYYTVKNYFVFKKDAKLHATAEVMGRRNEHLKWNIYIAFPIYESRQQKTKSPAAWLGIKYTQRIDNKLSDEEKTKKFDDFLEKSEADVNAKDLQKFVYLDRIASSDDLDGYLAAMKDTDNTIVLVPVHAPFAARNGHKPFWLCVSLFLGAFVWLLMLLKPKLNTEKMHCLIEKKSFTKDGELRDFFWFFIPKNDYFVTPILLNLNIFIFSIMFFSGAGFISLTPTTLLNWGANYTPYIAQGEYWRLLASIFLHGGIIHLVCNMSGLVFVGVCLEPILGKSKFILIYLLTGVLASLASVFWHADTASIGASGAIFGLYGVFLAVLMPKTLPLEIRNSLLGIAIIFIISNLIMGFTLSGIDNAAHLGGLASGFILGLLIDRDKKTALNLVKVVKIESEPL
jgi:membrane associated rhomboid family serine protease